MRQAYSRTAEEATALEASSKQQMVELIEYYKDELPDHELIFLQRSLQLKHRMPQQYSAPKVHKSPVAYRPVESTVNIHLGYLSKLCDFQLQQVAHLCPSYLQDSHALLAKMKNLGKLPPTAFLVTADATAMYTNIDKEHGIWTLTE